MKKLLALVLALVMTMGLATVGTNAATTKYADADSIAYKEAVDVMTAIGVLGGDASGFRPEDQLKRSEGAKIVAYLILGNKTAEAIQASGAKFTDVPANHWAAGYIEYLASIGVLGGVGGDKFDPDGQLTATQFAKMLLTALGYDAKIEGFGGADWAINVQRIANQVDLFDGNDSVVGSQPVTREEAALYAFNMIQAPLVEYETKGSSIELNGATINFGSTNAQYVTTTIAKTQTISKTQLTNSSNYTVEFAEKYYTKLTKDLSGNVTDAFNRPASKWSYDNAKIGTYADTADLSFTTSFTIAELYSGLGLDSSIGGAKVTRYVDGAADSWGGLDIVKGDNYEAHKVGGNGALTEVYYDASAGEVTIVVINTYVAKIASVTAATASKDAYVTLSTDAPYDSTAAQLGQTATTYETTGFAKDDIVAYTYSFKTGEGIKSMYKAEVVEGELTSLTVNTSATVGGATYKQSVAGKSISGDKASIGKTVNVYLDKYGYALYVNTTSAGTYAVLLGFEEGNSIDASRAKLLFTDGTTKTVNLTSKFVKSDGTEAAIIGNTGTSTDKFNYSSNELQASTTPQEISKYDIVKYTIDSSDKYQLTLVADANDATTSAKMTRGTINTSSGTNHANIAGVYGYSEKSGTTPNFKSNNSLGNLTMDGKTIFVVMNATGSSTTYTAYTGIGNVPTIDYTSAGTASSATGDMITVLDKKGDGVADIVFFAVKNGKVSSENETAILIKANGDGQTYVSSENYYVYDAVINGEPTQVKVSGTANIYTTTGALKDAGSLLLSGVTYDSKGIITSAANFAAIDPTFTTVSAFSNGTVEAGVGIDGYANGVIKIGGGSTPATGSAYAVAADANIWKIDADGKSITKIQPNEISTSKTNLIWGVHTGTSEVLKTIYIQEINELDTVATTSAKYAVKLTKSGATVELRIANNGGTGAYSGTLTITDTATGLVTTSDIAAGTQNSTSSVSSFGSPITLVTTSTDSKRYQATVTIDGVTLTTNAIIGG